MAVEERNILRIVLTEMAKEGLRYAPAGISMRHVHLSQKDLYVLFGEGYELQPLRELVQPGQFASREQVLLQGPKGSLEQVRIIGPVRKETQVELSMTDAISIGLKEIPVRMSGHIEGTPGIRIIGPKGEVMLSRGAMIAARHLHLSEEQARAFQVHDGQVVSVRTKGERSCILERIVCRTGEGHELEFHVDTDEANACGLTNGDLVEILPAEAVQTGSGAEDAFDPVRISEKVVFHLTGRKECRTDRSYLMGEQPVTVSGEELLDLVTEPDIDRAAEQGKEEVFCTRKALITPSAADRSRERGVRIIRTENASQTSVSLPQDGQEILELVTAGDLNVAFRDDRKEIFCTQKALITPAAKERIEETGIRVIRLEQ